jgi:hypothetical protein
MTNPPSGPIHVDASYSAACDSFDPAASSFNCENAEMEKMTALVARETEPSVPAPDMKFLMSPIPCRRFPMSTPGAELPAPSRFARRKRTVLAVPNGPTAVTECVTAFDTENMTLACHQHKDQAGDSEPILVDETSTFDELYMILIGGVAW